jgi:hypothetical protein
MITQLESVEDLWVFLRLYGIRADREELGALWKGVEEPVVVDEGEGSNSDMVVQIASVWGKDNARVVLWNSREVEVHYPGSPVFDYMDEGRYSYRGVILLFDPTSPRVLRMIRKHWNMVEEEVTDHRDLEFFRDEEPKFTLSYEEFSSMVRRFESMAKNGRDMDLELVRAWMNRVNEAEDNGLDAVSLDEEYIYMDGLRFGIEGVKLEEYLVPHVDEHPYHWIADPEEDLDQLDMDSVLLSFYSGVNSLTREGVYTMWLGKYEVELRVQRRNRRLYQFLEGVKVRRLDFQHALEQALEHPKEEYADFLRALWRSPEYVSVLRREGLTFIACDGPRGELSISLRFAKVGGRWYLISPVDGEMYHIPGGLRRIKQLDAHTPPAEWGPLYYRDIFELYTKLRGILPREHIIRTIRVSREEQRRAEEKSRMLLEETLEKYPDRVKEGTFNPEDHGYSRRELRGYVVKGKRRNYFIEEHRHGVFTYPEGRYVCIVDNHREGMALPSLDKLVSRIYLLMNDDELEGEVRTLRHHDELILRAN